MSCTESAEDPSSEYRSQPNGSGEEREEFNYMARSPDGPGRRDFQGPISREGRLRLP